MCFMGFGKSGLPSSFKGQIIEPQSIIMAVLGNIGAEFIFCRRQNCKIKIISSLEFSDKNIMDESWMAVNIFQPFQNIDGIADDPGLVS